MPTTLNRKGQVTIPKRIRDAVQWAPGTAIEFSVNAAGEVVLRSVPPTGCVRKPSRNRFDAVRGKADVPWRTDALMTLLRGDH